MQEAATGPKIKERRFGYQNPGASRSSAMELAPRLRKSGTASLADTLWFWKCNWKWRQEIPLPGCSAETVPECDSCQIHKLDPGQNRGFLYSLRDFLIDPSPMLRHAGCHALDKHTSSFPIF